MTGYYVVFTYFKRFPLMWMKKGIYSKPLINSTVLCVRLGLEGVSVSQATLILDGHMSYRGHFASTLFKPIISFLH